MNMHIRPLTTEEEHLQDDASQKRDTEALLKSVITPGWQRVWILTDEKEVYAEVTLVSRPPLKASPVSFDDGNRALGARAGLGHKAGE